jgi:proteic killer suppression protein
VEVEFFDKDLEQVEQDKTATAGHGDAIDKSFRKKMQFIRAAKDERDLRNMKSLRFKRLEGARKHQHSIRLNDQWRLILELREIEGRTVIGVIGIEDYH